MMKLVFLVLTHFPITESFYKLRLIEQEKSRNCKNIIGQHMSPNAIHLIFQGDQFLCKSVHPQLPVTMQFRTGHGCLNPQPDSDKLP